MVSTVVWKNVDALGAILDMKLATFLVALLLVVVVSGLRPPRPGSVAAAGGAPGS
jgi:hypothetical protein